MPEFTQLPLDFTLPLPGKKQRKKKEAASEPGIITNEDGSIDLGEYVRPEPKVRRIRWNKKMEAASLARSEHFSKCSEFLYVVMRSFNANLAKARAEGKDVSAFLGEGQSRGMDSAPAREEQ